jgi:pimeloyl-ACP methyl ester carboxylesterase
MGSTETSRLPSFFSPVPSTPEQPLFIFLPGMDGSGQLLRRQLKGLESYFSIRCLSIPVDDATSWFEMVQAVAALVRAELTHRQDNDNCQAPQPVYLCGESFGGCLALELAAIAPELFQRIILINPASAFAQLPWMSAASLLAPSLSPFLYSLSAAALVPLLISWDRVEPIDRQALLSAMQAISPKSAAWRLDLLRKFNALALPLKQMAQPTLIIAGGQDKLLPSISEAQRLVRLLPTAQMIVLPESGHACLLEKNVDLSKILHQQRFLLPETLPKDLNSDMTSAAEGSPLNPSSID